MSVNALEVEDKLICTICKNRMGLRICLLCERQHCRDCKATDVCKDCQDLYDRMNVILQEKKDNYEEDVQIIIRKFKEEAKRRLVNGK